MVKLLIIGADSFIAGKFIEAYHNDYEIIGYSRVPIDYCSYILSTHFFDVNDFHLKWADIVLNFAAIVHQPNLKDDLLYKKINAELPVYIANAAKKTQVKHFIQMSTIAVYGNVDSIDINTPENPKNIYGKTKLDADLVLLEIQDENFRVSIIRSPMVYGGGNAPGNIMKLIQFAQKGIPLPFKGVNNRRDFIHIQNLVEVLKLVIGRSISDVIIPTDKSSVSTEEITNFISKYSKKRIRQIRIPKIILFLVKRLAPSTYSKVFGSLHVACNLDENIYQPSYTLEDGIKEMLQVI